MSSNDHVLLNGTHGLFFGGTSKHIELDNLTACNNSVTTLNSSSGVFFDSSVDKITILGGMYGNEYAGHISCPCFVFVDKLGRFG